MSRSHQPYLYQFPIQNNRTAWGPVWLPVLLVVPWKRNKVGDSVSNSQIISLSYLIEEAPDRAKVAGPEHRGLFVPESQLFRLDIGASDLFDQKIDLAGRVFYQGGDLTKEITFAQAVEGDSFDYTLIRGTRDQVPFYPDADYYDLSIYQLDTGSELPKNDYFFTYEVEYYNRLITEFGELVCVDPDDVRLTRFRIRHQHPGDIHHQMTFSTPAVYFDQSTELKDSEMVRFYRPLADALQDIADEQTLLDGLNRIDRIPAQLVPYLAYLIGVELPYFPSSTDNMRRTMLRQGTLLNKLKGTKRAIQEIFAIFGFAVDLVNLWTSTDGKIFIAPDENLDEQYDAQQITRSQVCHIEPNVQELNESGFGDFDIPLLYRPDGNITLYAFRADNTTQLNEVVQAFNRSTTAFEEKVCGETTEGFLFPTAFMAATEGTYLGEATVLLDPNGQVIAEDSSGSRTINGVGCSYDRRTNRIRIVFDHYLDLQSEYLYIYAAYRRETLSVPGALNNLEANRFDVDILSKEGGLPPADMLDFLVDEIFRFKAFHSLLRRINYTVEVADVYNVGDFCMGGEVRAKPGTDLGEIQVPPPIAPEDPSGECTLNRGFKEEDLSLRSAIVQGLEEEFEAWKAVEGHKITNEPLFNALAKIQAPTESLEDETLCAYNVRGQDRTQKVDEDCNTLEDGRDGLKPQCGTYPAGDILPDGDLLQEKLDTDPRATICNIENNVLDYCYRGRVKEILDTQMAIQLQEALNCHPCKNMLGKLVFWLQDADPAKKMLIETLGNPVARARSATTDEKSNLFVSDSKYLPSEPANNAVVYPHTFLSAYVERDNLMFPGHRTVNITNLPDTFVSTSWPEKPWDSTVSCEDPDPDPLHAEIVSLPNGDTDLSYDVSPYTILGNGLPADIPFWGDHSTSPIDASKVTHSIFTTAPEGIAQLEAVVHTDEDAINYGNGIFPSSSPFCLEADEEHDFIDGYPAGTGHFSSDMTGYCDDRPPLLCGVMEDLGLPTSVTDVTSADFLFLLGSGVRVDRGEAEKRFWVAWRLDCGCLRFDCGTGGTGTEAPYQLEVDRCSIDLYDEPNGSVEYDCDKLEILPVLALPQPFGACSQILDGNDIPSLFSLNGASWIEGSADWPDKGSLFFQDAYGIITEVVWISDENEIDILWSKKDPRIPGEPDQGFVDNWVVYRKGIITVERAIYERVIVGNQRTYATVSYELLESRIDYFRTTWQCETAPTDPFTYHLDCSLTDPLHVKIDCGGRWGDPSDADDDNVGWPEVDGSLPVGFDELFYWVNGWGNEDAGLGGCPGTGTGTGGTG